jgi:Zn-dependent protease with chaperone function
MAADFFERQDAARRNTTRLVLLFAAAVAAMVVSIDVLIAAVLGYTSRDPRTGAIDWSLAASADILFFATAATLVVVGGGSLYKIAQLRGGGRVVAESLGGQRLNPDTTVPSERQLLNVVDEMAIASGVPAPPVYLLAEEDGINAFAAGFTPDDAVIGVTRGTIERLTRNELQGVVAHEFSHILNGDMRLNVRLIGVLNGILIVGMIGYFVLRSAAFSSHGRRRSRDGNPVPILAIGAGLMAIGFFGTFFGNLIKAGVSRQREFLADASAVQFTRQPEGLAGALRKIGGLTRGSAIRHPNAPEASHLFFGRATSGFSAFFSTHPPLEARIRAIDPSWDGTFPAVDASADRRTVGEALRADAGVRPRPEAMSGLAGTDAGARAEASRGARPETSAATMVAQVGRPTETHLAYAAHLIGGLPPAVRDAAHESYGARALVYALLIDRDVRARHAQLARLETSADPGVYRAVGALMPMVDQLERRARLPVVDLALPALRQLTSAQYGVFRANVDALVATDDRIDLFEWSLQRVLLRDLERQFGRAEAPRVRHRALAPLLPHVEAALSTLAHVGHDDPAVVAHAFEQGRRAVDGASLRLRAPEECGLGVYGLAMDAFESAAPALQRRILTAAAACILADRQITASEAELLRATAAVLRLPMPPLLESQG